MVFKNVLLEYDPTSNENDFRKVIWSICYFSLIFYKFVLDFRTITLKYDSYSVIGALILLNMKDFFCQLITVHCTYRKEEVLWIKDTNIYFALSLVVVMLNTLKIFLLCLKWWKINNSLFLHESALHPAYIFQCSRKKCPISSRARTPNTYVFIDLF